MPGPKYYRVPANDIIHNLTKRLKFQTRFSFRWTPVKEISSQPIQLLKNETRIMTKPTHQDDNLTPVDTDAAKQQSSLKRRSFLKSTAALAAIPYFAWSKPAFANVAKNDRPQIGCIGLGGMGRGDAHQHFEFGDIVACCDVDQKHIDKSVNDPKIGNGKADGYQDYRKVLERDDIDVVSIVTPDHWHVKASD